MEGEKALKVEAHRAPATFALVAINVVIFFALSFFGRTEDAGFMIRHGAVYLPLMKDTGEFYQFFTSIFLHFGFQHLMNNMLMLIVMGLVLEPELGTVKYLILYIVSGLGGNLISAGFEAMTGEYSVSAGASGAIFGVVGGLIYLAILGRGRIGNLTERGLIFLVLMNIYYGVTSTGIDNMAHIGGLAAGFVMAVILYRRPGRV